MKQNFLDFLIKSFILIANLIHIEDAGSLSMFIKIIELPHKASETLDFTYIIMSVDAANVLDMGKADEMWSVLKTYITGGVTKIIINMENLDFIDSIGISVLINAAKQIRVNKGEIVLTNVSERIEGIFRPVNLNRFIQIVRSETEALSILRLI